VGALYDVAQFLGRSTLAEAVAETNPYLTAFMYLYYVLFFWTLTIRESSKDVFIILSSFCVYNAFYSGFDRKSMDWFVSAIPTFGLFSSFLYFSSVPAQLQVVYFYLPTYACQLFLLSVTFYYSTAIE